jgi:hypothetical protein
MCADFWVLSPPPLSFTPRYFFLLLKKPKTHLRLSAFLSTFFFVKTSAKRSHGSFVFG